MDWRTRIRTALSAVGHEAEDDVVEELAQHARAAYDAARAEGASTAEAMTRVDVLVAGWQRESGRLHHKVPTGSPMAPAPPPVVTRGTLDGLTQDIRYAARILWRQPRYALLVILTIAVGIAATTTIFGVLYGVLMKPLPWPDGERLVQLQETRGGRPPRFLSFTNAALLAWRGDAQTVTAIAGWSQSRLTLTNGTDVERVLVTNASPGFFDVLGVQPLHGAFFRTSADIAAPVVVLSERLWRQRFGSDPAAVGRSIDLDGITRRIIGVAPDHAAFPDRSALAVVPFEIRDATGNFLSLFHAIARLAPGVTPEQASAEGTARGRFAPDTGMTTTAIFGGTGPLEVQVTRVREAATADVRQPLVVLFAAVGLLFVAATANVASLQLARATTRRREIAIRGALGAGRARVVRQLVVESLLVGLAGGAVGLGAATVLYRGLPALLPPDFPRADGLAVDWPVAAFAMVAATLTSLVCGLLPSLGLRRLTLTQALVDDGGGAVGARTGRPRLLIMSGQVAIACVLLVGASLFGRSFVALLHADRGYEPAGVLTARVTFPGSLDTGPFSAERRSELSHRMLDRLSRLPGVVSAAFTSDVPLTPGGSAAAFTLPPRAAGGEPVAVQASPRVVSPAYFDVLRFRVSAGRGFSNDDTDTSAPVVVVNRTFARRYLDDEALGASLPMALGYGDSGRQATVVGVVEDVRYPSGATAQPELYYSSRQLAGRLTLATITWMVRTASAPEDAAPGLRAAVPAVDAGLVAESVMSFEDRVLTGLARPRLYAVLLAGFAAFALVVAVVGLFGVLSYIFAERTREMALRTALGARPGDIMRLVLGQGLTVAAIGIAAGLAVSAVTARSIATLLYGVSTHDTATYLAVPAILLTAALAAAWPPARRAARAEPARELRR